LSAPDEPNFAEPWQAQAFALVQTLTEAGVFSTSEWSDMLGETLRHRPDDDGRHYYEAYVEALEALVVGKGAAQACELGDVREAWRRAYETTPHGEPVELKIRPPRSAGDGPVR
jgi:nitrile hydratase accessory protein